jgi:hypothetical protein
MQLTPTLKTLLLTVAVSGFMTACGGTNSQRSFTPPAYANPTGDSWMVRCAEGRVVIPLDRTEFFYKSNGEQKTMDEFCGESRFDTAIRPPGSR